MDKKSLNELFKSIRVKEPSKLAEELLSVQPMPDNLFSEILKHSMDERQLTDEGYRPVSPLKLMWVKKDDKTKSD